MIVGIPKEIKDNERRVAIIPAGVAELTKRNHKVLIERGAGLGSSINDDEYVKAGAKIVESPKDVFKNSDMILKVKEPLESEYDLLQDRQTLFTYLHLAANEKLTRVLMKKNIKAIAYETVEVNGQLPLLKPMSEVAGQMSIIIASQYLQHMYGGKGVLPGGVPGVKQAEVVVIGAGVVGLNAIKMAVGMGASVTVLDVNIDALRRLDDMFGSRIKTLASNTMNIADAVERADLVIGAVLIPGMKAPTLVTRDMLATMQKNSLVIDVAVDQGGCIETTTPTTHSNPTFFVDGILHYCVANMPGAVPNTSTYALSNATMPYVTLLADMGADRVVRENEALAKGLNVNNGRVVCSGVAEAFKIA
ncbi:alanine dehydrogenase [Dethiobacter alkaliphilus]|uniref:alanine dehydrogenase n=1 Tax=Dethiobacter alkaliphilus TaxID=427926 RepID=UPI0022263343|nr:alanine dehydrogenase [Dethiobacter alkaliphilus]MCW3489497.1 alanine dehydrogenase [Dethiobacter alkaliphilus]